MLNTRQIKDRSTAQTPQRATGFWQSLSGALSGQGERRSLFSRKGANPTEIRAGRMFRYDNGSGRLETATVIGLCEILGMTHVRYDLRIDKPGHRPFEDGPRVLGMKCFLEHFREPIGS
ncbi:MAG: hypothetical protein RH942_19650 [Kiloniellaceae bacterium]